LYAVTGVQTCALPIWHCAESWTRTIAEIVTTPREHTFAGSMPEEVPHPRH